MVQPSEMDQDTSLINLNEFQMDKNLTDEEKEELEQLLRRHPQCFTGRKGLTHLVEHNIETGDARPIHTAPRREPQAERKHIQSHVDKMLRDEIVSPSRSPWSSPVVLIEKKNGEIWF